MPIEIAVDRLVEWAYIELLKRGSVGTLAQQWNALSDYGERGWTAIDDDWRADLRMPAGAGTPHADALTIERAVQGLGEVVTLDWPAHRVLILGELLALAGDGDPLAGQSFNGVALVETFARQGRRPRWDIGQPIARQVAAGNNRGVMLTGRNYGKGRFATGAACAVRYDPSIEQIAQSRAEYFVWRKSLEKLRGLLRASTLADHMPTEPSAPAEPWLDRSTPIAVKVWTDGASPFRSWEPIKKGKGKKARQRAAPGIVPVGD